jgi:hypothetical protein
MENDLVKVLADLAENKAIECLLECEEEDYAMGNFTLLIRAAAVLEAAQIVVPWAVQKVLKNHRECVANHRDALS